MRRGEAGLCGDATIDVHRTSCALRVSVFSKEHRSLKSLRARARSAAWRPWRCSIAMEFMERRDFIWRPRKVAFAHTSARKSRLRSAGVIRYSWNPAQATRIFAALITRMKLRRQKRRRTCCRPKNWRNKAGLICLTGGEEGPLAHALTQGGIDSRNRSAFGELCEIFGRENVYVELQRHLCREEEARNQAAVEIAQKIGFAVAGDEWRDAMRSRSSGNCWMCSPAFAITALWQPPDVC